MGNELSITFLGDCQTKIESYRYARSVRTCTPEKPTPHGVRNRFATSPDIDIEESVMENPYLSIGCIFQSLIAGETVESHSW